MKYKFTLVFVFFLQFNALNASIHFNETDFAYQFFLNDIAKPILILPKQKGHTFSFGQQETKLKSKLGSYDFEHHLLKKTKNIEIQRLEVVNANIIHVYYSCYYNKALVDFQLKLEERDGELKLSLNSDLPPEVNYISFNLFNTSSAIFGGGIQFSHCNLKGKSFPLIVEENGVGRGDKGSTFLAGLLGASGNEFTSYAPLPFFLTSNQLSYSATETTNGYWEVNFESKNYLHFKFNRFGKDRLRNSSISIRQGEPLDLISQQNQIDRNVLPDWMFGYVLGIQGGKEKVNQKVRDLQYNNINVSAVWIQDWVGKRQTSIGSRLQWDWKPNESVYPHLQEWIDSLHQEKIKVLGYINPYFVDCGGQAKVGIDNSYFVMNSDGSSYKFKAGGFEAYMLDLSNIEARKWAKNIIKDNLIQNGFDGWMCDFGEWLPFDANLKNDLHLSHNSFSVEWLKLNWEVAQELGKQDDLFIFNRSAYSGTNELPSIMWLGDQMGNFGVNDGLASAVNAYNSSALSGFPIMHSDVGGYTAIKLGPFKFLRNDEILKRWIEMEAFTPLWRSHEGLMPDDMSQIYQDEEMMAFFAKFDKIHLDLVPYFKEVNLELLQDGVPFIRHPFMLYPSDEETYNLQYQFFVGSDLLVCPVIEENMEKIRIYLPKGNWQHFFTKEIFSGGKFYSIAAPIGQPAVFWKQ